MLRLFWRNTVQTEALVPLVALQFDQPANVELRVGAAVSVIVVPYTNWSLQADGVEQLMPEPVTVPVPAPAKPMVRIGSGPAGVQPRLAGPSTTMCASLLETRLGLS